ncbi:type II toxin-antitoxin system mRNA interferase toxin, RelE/StbE family [Candidatus Gottesmanbacteria bacterium]|nr:type II toxin-antitoxin system mRNA interferase toxin, RelE/StbE family [Candidatus Gottesmanbacteria bacterium]
MKVEFTSSFIKIYKKRFFHLSSIREQFEERTRLFEKNPYNPILHDHALKGNKIGLRAFSITGDIRVVYYIHEEIAYFDDIGSHNQIY